MPFIPVRNVALPLALAALLALMAPLVPNSFIFGVMIFTLLNAATAVALNLFVGSAGQISLGHAAFFGIGAYAVAILPGNYGVPPLAALLAGALLTGALAFVVGRPILRLAGHYLAMATLGIGVIVYLVINQEIALTGGPDGKAVLPLTLVGMTILGDLAWYAIAAGFLVIVVWISLNLLETGYGRALRALHASEAGAQAVGIDTARAKVTVFVFSACIASIAGSLYALYTGFVTPGEAGFLKSVSLVIMIVVGGLGSVAGAVIGAALITTLPQLLARFHDYEHLVFGLLLMIVAVFLRRGIVPTLVGYLTRGETR